MNETKCQCGGILGDIRIVDKTTVTGGGHFDLEYTVPETKQSFWSVPSARL